MEAVDHQRLDVEEHFCQVGEISSEIKQHQLHEGAPLRVTCIRRNYSCLNGFSHTVLDLLQSMGFGFASSLPHWAMPSFQHIHIEWAD